MWKSQPAVKPGLKTRSLENHVAYITSLSSVMTTDTGRKVRISRNISVEENRELAEEEWAIPPQKPFSVSADCTK